MSKTHIPRKTQIALWARAGGRCEFRGCNKELIGDLVAGREDGHFGFLAHIVADEADGPRGDAIRSPQLAKDINNLMLMCAEHHKGIDTDWLADYPEPVLVEMKLEHEDRISIVTALTKERASHVLRFAANIGSHPALVSARSLWAAMPPDHHPAERSAIDLELSGLTYQDHEPQYWSIHQDNLRRQFGKKVTERIEQGEIRQMNVFALAPQPLLIELGRLLGDISPARVHQKTRTPDTWGWLADRPPIRYRIAEYDGPPQPAVALKLEVTAAISDERIQAVLGKDVAIWSLASETPGIDTLRRLDDLLEYGRKIREVYSKIKAKHGEAATICVFPALPNSAAVETGRAWMPKADLPLKIYDQNSAKGGFIPTIMIES